MKKILIIWLCFVFVFAFTEASEYNGSIDSSNGISTNSLEVTLPCNPASVSNGSVHSSTCVITCNAWYTLSSNQCTASWGGGWWGGGGGFSTVTSNSWQVTSTGNTLTTEMKTLSGEVEGSSHTSAGDITNSPYSSELNQAYQFAFEHWITTQSTIQKANMGGVLIRSHMAKIMVNYAINILGRTVNTWVMCDFKDVQHESSEMKFYAKWACQLGIMWVSSDGSPASLFNPMGVVTRAEFGTALSRLLYWSLYNGWSPYHVTHLSALKRAGIMKNTLSTNKEIRGYVMLMLMRAAQD